jgi:hypothetical protein
MVTAPRQRNQFNLLRQQIYSSLEKAQTQRTILKCNNARLITANIILSTVAAVLAGFSGTAGTAATWKPICIIGAVCSAGVAMTTKMQTPEQLTELCECVGQLKALRVEMITTTGDLEEISEKYQQILSEFSTIDC